MADLHKSHEGINKSLTLARTCVYWPGMEVDVTGLWEEMSDLHRQHQTARGDTTSTQGPTGPWVKVGMDFFQGDSGNTFLIIADYFSKFPYLYRVASTHHANMLMHLRDLFSAEGMCQLYSWRTTDLLSTVKSSDSSPEEFDFVHQDIFTTLLPVQWVHWINGEEGQGCIQVQQTEHPMLKPEHCCNFETPR